MKLKFLFLCISCFMLLVACETAFTPIESCEITIKNTDLPQYEKLLESISMEGVVMSKQDKRISEGTAGKGAFLIFFDSKHTMSLLTVGKIWDDKAPGQNHQPMLSISVLLSPKEQDLRNNLFAQVLQRIKMVDPQAVCVLMQ
jgi:hypothetical protein